MRDRDNALVETDGEYRGCPIIANQSERRLTTVRADIDRSHSLDDPVELEEFAFCIANAPESRALAASRLVAMFELAVDERRKRPANFDPDLLRCEARLMYSRRWQDPYHYCSLLDGRLPPLGQGPQPVKRERPLSDEERGR
jgi:hypothetical protein